MYYDDKNKKIKSKNYKTLFQIGNTDQTHVLMSFDKTVRKQTK